MTLPASIRVNVRANFPANVSGSGFIAVAKSNGKYTVKPDYYLLAPAPSTPQIIAVQDPTSKSFSYIYAIANMMPIVDFYKVASDPDDSLSFTRAFAANSTVYGMPSAIYTIGGIALNGQAFDGRNCVVRDAAGAPFCFRLLGYRPKLRNVEFQDQGNVAKVTTNAGGFASNASSFAVADPTGFAAGQQIIFEGNGTNWMDTRIASMSGSTVSLNNVTSETGASGLTVVASFGLVHLTDSDQAEVENLLFNNANVGLLISTTTGEVRLPRLKDIRFESGRYCMGAKYGDVHDLDFDGFGGFFGATDIYNYVGDGTAGDYGSAFPISLIREVAVTVNGVAKTYGVDYTFLNEFAVTFLTGAYPAVGAAVSVRHFHSAVRGWVEDQRGTTVSGGNRFNGFRILNCIIAMELNTVQLSDYIETNLDTNSEIGLQISNCGFDLNFTALSSTWARRSVVSFNSSGVRFNGLTTDLIPNNQVTTFNPVTGPEIDADSTSSLDVDLNLWESPSYLYSALGQVNLFGGRQFNFASSSSLTAGSTTYLGASGNVSVHQPIDILDNNCFVVSLWIALGPNSPGGSETITVSLIENAESVSPVTLLTFVIPGSSFGGFWAGPPVAAAKFSTVSVQVVYSSGAATSFVRGFFIRR